MSLRDTGPERVWDSTVLASLDRAFNGAADQERAVAMAAYMRDQFPFLGIASAERRRLIGRALADAPGKPTEVDLDAFARACYDRPEREYHYAAVNVLRRRVKVLTPASVSLVHHLVITHSWWDTVDEIASHLAGGLVSAYPALVNVMDEWARSDNMWVARTAILHQLGFKERTDADRLFSYCRARADEVDFFYRKAIGWALRQYARTDPTAVKAFCETNAEVLSPLSYREATKHL